MEALNIINWHFTLIETIYSEFMREMNDGRFKFWN